VNGEQSVMIALTIMMLQLLAGVFLALGKSTFFRHVSKGEISVTCTCIDHRP